MVREKPHPHMASKKAAWSVLYSSLGAALTDLGFVMVEPNIFRRERTPGLRDEVLVTLSWRNSGTMPLSVLCSIQLDSVDKVLREYLAEEPRGAHAAAQLRVLSSPETHNPRTYRPRWFLERAEDPRPIADECRAAYLEHAEPALQAVTDEPSLIEFMRLRVVRQAPTPLVAALCLCGRWQDAIEVCEEALSGTGEAAGFVIHTAPELPGRPASSEAERKGLERLRAYAQAKLE